MEFRVPSEMCICILTFLSLNLYFFTYSPAYGTWDLIEAWKSLRSLAAGSVKHWYQYRLRDEWTERSSAEDLFVLVDERWHELAMCFCNPKSQSNPGLHRKKCGQQVNRADSGHLQCSVETQPGILHLAWVPGTERTSTCWSESKGGPQKLSEGWIIWSSAMRPG